MSSDPRHLSTEKDAATASVPPASVPEPTTVQAAGASDPTPEVPVAEIAPPPRVPGYQFLEFLGRGTYGEVWKARQETTGIVVAIKFFTRGTAEQWRMLLAEVGTIAQLHGVRGIVQLEDVGAAAQPPYYIMAYAEQGSLADRLAHGPIPAEHALELFRQLAEALAYVHAKGIRHCDLKPGNVLLDARGNALLADFGQAHLDSDNSPALGTFFYMAPEQATLRSQLPDTSWDVYALGALFFAMLTGEAPRASDEFRQEIAGTVRLEHRLDRYRQYIQRHPRPAGHRKVRGVDRALADVIDHCLEVDTAHRLRNAAAVLDALDRRERARRLRPLLLFALVAPLLLLGLLGYASERQQGAAIAPFEDRLKKQLLDSDRDTARLMARSIQQRLNVRLERLERAATPRLAEATRKGDQAELERRLKLILTSNDRPNRLFTEATVSDAGGKVRALVQVHAPRGPTGALELVVMDPARAHKVHPNLSWRDWFSGRGDRWEERDRLHSPVRDLHLSAPYVSSIDGTAFVSVSVPIWEGKPGQGDPVGVLEAALDLDELNRWMREVDLTEGKGFLAVYDRRGHSLEHRERKRIRPRPQQPPERWTLPAEVAENKDGTLEHYRDPVDDKDYLAGYARVDDARVGWVVVVQHQPEVVREPIGELEGRMDRIRWQAYAMATVLTVGLWGWLFWLLRQQAA